MNIEKNALHIGLEKPLKILHITDSHIGLCDNRDNERKMALAERLGKTDRIKIFEKQLDYGKDNCDLIVHTGDLIDFTSQANFDFARKVIADEKVFFSAGNHEFSQYLGEAYEDFAYKMNSFREMQPGLGAPLFFNSKIIGGVNFVSIDNSYHQFEPWQMEKLKREITKGFPIVLCLHVPLFEQSLYDFYISRTVPGECTYLAGCDEEHLPSDEWRAIEIRPRGVTCETIDFIKSHPQIKAVLAGHLHISFVSEIATGKPQFVTGSGYANYVRELTIT